MKYKLFKFKLRPLSLVIRITLPIFNCYRSYKSLKQQFYLI